MESALSAADRLSALQAAFDALGEPAAIISGDGAIAAVNHAWMEASVANGEWEEGACAGRPYALACQVADGPGAERQAEVGAGLGDVLSGVAQSFDLAYAARSSLGETPWRLDIRRLPGGVPGALAVHRRLPEAAAPARDDRRDDIFDDMADRAPVLIWVSDAQGRCSWFNQRWLESSGASLAAEVAADWQERIHPDDRGRCREQLAVAMARRSECAREYRLRGAARDHRWIQERAKPLYHRDQTFAGYIGSCTDITDIKLVEENLQRHRDHLDRQLRFAGTLNRMTQAITGLDGSRGILDALVGILGEALAIERCLIVEVSLARRVALRAAAWRSPACPPAGHAASDHPIDAFPETLRHLWEMRAPLESHADHPHPRFASEGSAALLHQGQGIRSLLWYPFGFRADGFSLFMLDQFSSRRPWGADERHFLEAVANQVNLAMQKIRITAARAEAEEALRRSLQMEAMSRLAGGVANDFNNQLTAISGHAGLLGGALAADDPLRRHVDAIRTASERASTTTRQLLAFSRHQVTQLADVDPAALLEQLGRTLRPLLGEEVALVIAAEAGIGVRADARQLESALVNVAINAREAMPAGGTLRISTSAATLDRETAQRHGVGPGVFVCIQVADTGVGMDQATLANVFEPYFSTKQPGGAGLGLSSAHGQVAAMGGFITLVSCPGRGTTASIWLPGAGLDPRAEPIRRPPPLHPLSGGGSETVLVVEDEPAVLDLVRDTLRHAGYNVLAASHAEEAVRHAAQHRGDIHLLLTDVAMPKTSGTALAGQLAATRPAMRIIFMSGYAVDAFAVNREVGGAGFLAKPFTIDELTRAVRAALDVRWGRGRGSAAGLRRLWLHFDRSSTAMRSAPRACFRLPRCLRRIRGAGGMPHRR